MTIEPFVLQRIYHGDDCTLGTLTHGKSFFCYTLELPWMFNHQYVSCIPAADYKVKNYASAKYPNHYQIMDVPGRSHILIHVGNTRRDIVGCIVLGERLGRLKGLRAVLNSGKTFRYFRNYLKSLEAFADGGLDFTIHDLN